MEDKTIAIYCIIDDILKAILKFGQFHFHN